MMGPVRTTGRCRKKWLRAAGHLSLVLLPFGCQRRAPQTFALEYPVVAKAETLTTKRMLVEEFTIASEYARQTFVYRSSPYELHYDSLRRWAAPPEVMVRERVIRGLRGAGLFERVLAEPGLQPPGLVLGARILKIGERIDGAERFAELSIQFDLLDGKSRKPIWSATKDTSEKVGAERFELAIQALSKGLKKILGEIVLEIAEATSKAGSG